MPDQLSPSVLGNVVAARSRLSAVRQRMGLEPDAGQMRQLHPLPPDGPANKPGAAAKTVSSGPPRPPRPPARPQRPARQPAAKKESPSPAPNMAPADDEDFDEDQFVIGDELRNRLLGKIQVFIDENNNGIDDRQEAATPAAASTGRTPEELANIAFNPFREFYSQNKRLPTVDEMKALVKS